MPEKFVPQMTAFDTGANRAIVSTAVKSWNRPWPNSSGRAGVVAELFGTMQTNGRLLDVAGRAHRQPALVRA